MPSLSQVDLHRYHGKIRDKPLKYKHHATYFDGYVDPSFAIQRAQTGTACAADRRRHLYKQSSIHFTDQREVSMFWDKTHQRPYQMLRKGLLCTLFVAATFAYALNAHASVYKCLDNNGSVVFQDRACSGDLFPATRSTAGGIATTPAASSQPTPESDQPGSAFFWHAQSTTGTVYLLGSVHFGREDMYPLPETVMKAFDNASTLIVEADVTALDPMQAGALLAGKAMYTNGDTLQSELDADTWERLTQVGTKLGLPPQLLNMQKPWMASMTLMALAVKQLGYSETLGIDMYFLNRARGKKQIVELEGLAWQTDLMASLSTTEQMLLLTDAIRMAEEGNIYFDRMITAWKQGNTAQLTALMEESFGNSPAAATLNKKMLTDRNAAMAAKIHNLASGGATLFVVVGAAHMIGDDGLVTHLRRQGYTVDQL